MAPIVPLMLIGGGIGLLVLLMSRKDEKKPSTEKVIKDIKESGVAPLIEKAEKTKQPVLLTAAAAQAAAAGKTELATALKKRADGMKVEENKVVYKSPIPQANPEQWTNYVNCSKSGNNVATATGSYGLFNFGVRRLVDLGVMKNPTQTFVKGKRIWVADWVPPWSTAKFLADSAFQYQLFLKSNLEYYKRIQAEVAKKTFPVVPGGMIDGTRITLSGILAVAKMAGYAGMKKWLTSPKDRQKFVLTTSWFKKCNGIF